MFAILQPAGRLHVTTSTRCNAQFKAGEGSMAKATAGAGNVAKWANNARQAVLAFKCTLEEARGRRVLWRYRRTQKVGGGEGERRQGERGNVTVTVGTRVRGACYGSTRVVRRSGHR